MELTKIVFDVEEFNRLIDTSKKVVIVCHMGPDGDALGSSLGLCHVLIGLGKKANVITPDMPPRQLDRMHDYQSIVVYSNRQQLAEMLIGDADLIICLDFNHLHRIDRLAPLIMQAKADKILIDHHIGPDDFAKILISRPEKSSTSLLLYMVLCEAGRRDQISLKAAECLLTGMLTDTGGLSFNSNDPDLYLAIADLVAQGANKDRITKLVFNTNTESRLRICGYALSRRMLILPQHRTAIISLTRNDLDDFDYKKGDTESLVNSPLSIDDMVCSIFIREDREGYVKVSMRSVGDYHVNTICENHFGGGGHANAAGGDFYGDIDGAIKKILEVLPLYDKYLPKKER